MKRTDKDVMILLHKPVKTVVGKKKKGKRLLKAWYLLSGMAKHGCYKEEGKCTCNQLSNPACVWTSTCGFWS